MAFAIIFAIIIVGIIVAVGFTQIQQFFCFGSVAQTDKAVKDIESLADEVFVLSEGSSKTYLLALPSDSKLCFINRTHPDVTPYLDPGKTWNPDPLVISQMLRNPSSPSYQAPLWIYRCGDSFGQGYKMRYLSPSRSFCSRHGDQLVLENKGRTVDISI